VSSSSLVTDVLKPWYLIEYALREKNILPSMIEGHLLKGHGKQVFYVVNQTRYSFPNGDTFEGLGFDWADVWELGDNEVNMFASGGDIASCDGKTCISSMFYQKKNVTAP
jgi:hypothetical protein